ncbi:DNA-binding response regulator, OmpR family, contains REC and winged-helix (wHTH) domain [Pseudomonas sp. LAIL14HWK12:I11]|jgi:Response regulators consisting of a CheY-like receiver domain and a winged-helix DNA-binding domain|nr:DNA-binding response regulator, OmpR family, contains REC and winged-helix (wHTH) domain [Pseudomonas sp. LAIL14HWK12:I11]SMR75001.1 DNA-binding response regulator, OmpR family, contains REC and winged-helix (wHTH) domain [Pseudomonas sp. LAIL14HWK12:I10]SOD02273.1 DNA-binding response regulator, OmpR family, contains REC and winged-helix (wHTH) domain [Pseudomonas sp. LAIL14HWK12:I8]
MLNNRAIENAWQLPMNPVAIHTSTILAIEDDPVLGAYLHEELQRGGFQVTWCRNGLEGLETAGRQAFDVVLMDILLPGLNGLDALAQLRTRSTTPVILMSALGAEADRISGFQRGADDYLPKPFSMAELQVRIEAILRRVALERRHQPQQEAAGGGLQFDEGLSDVRLEGRLAGLTPSEYRLLEILNRNLDEVLSKPFLYQQVLQRGYSRHDRSLDMHVSQIRRKLKGIGYHERQIRTVWGKGYVLSASEME